MRNKLQNLSPANKLLILAICGIASFFVYLEFITKRAFLLDLYSRGTNFGTIVGADKPTAYSTFLIFIFLFAIYLAAWWASRSLKSREAWLLVLGWALLLSIPMLLLYPYGARDVFDYVMRARIFSVYGGNPFVNTASAFPNDLFYSFAWWKEYPSPYGPLWELLAGLATKAAGNNVLTNILAFKFIGLIFTFATSGFIALTLRRHAPERALSGTLLFLWNPLVLFEVIGNAHNDITMLVWVAAAIWAAAGKRWYLTVWFLALGAVFKFIPVLLLPSAGLIGLANHEGWRAKLKYFVIAGLVCAVIWLVAYIPFWDGIKTLTFLKQGSLFTTSFASLVFYNFQLILGKGGRQIISTSAIVFTILVSLGSAIRASRKPNWESFSRSATIIFLFYVLVTCTWYQNWYLLWPFTAAVFLPGGYVMQAAVLFTVTGLVKPFVAMPLFSWLAKPGSPILQENRITLVSQGIPWLLTLFWISKSTMEKINRRKILLKSTIRECLEEDIPTVTGLITQLAQSSGITKEFESAALQRLFREMQIDPGHYANYVYLTDGKVTGFISVVFYQTFFHRVGTAQVNELIVDENQRGQGIGKALMKAAELEARRRGMDELEVGTESDNLNAQKFYRKYGFDEEYILFGMEFSSKENINTENNTKKQSE